MTTRARRKPKCSRERSMRAGNSADALMRGDSGKPVTGSRHGPWSSAVHEQERYGVEQEGRHDLVDPEADAQQRREQGPRRARQRAADDHDRQCDERRQPADHGADARCGDRAEQQLALRADVPVPGPEGDRHCGAGEQDRRGADEHLEQRER